MRIEPGRLSQTHSRCFFGIAWAVPPNAQDRPRAGRWRWEGLTCLALYVLGAGGFLATHSGSYIDEYLHLFTGQAWLAHGAPASFYVGEPYERGAAISLLAGLAMWLGGPHLWAAKCVPLALGGLSWASMLSLVRGLWPERTAHRYALYALALISPYAVFNHFYLRMYALYEAGLLADLWLLYSLQRALDAGATGALARTKRAALLLALAAVNLGVLLGGREPGAAMVLAATAVGLAWIALRYERVPGKPPAARTVALRASGLVALAAASLSLPQVRAALGFWLAGELHFTSRADHKFTSLFLVQLGPLSAFFALGCFALFRRGRPGQLVAVVAAALLSAHLLASADLQITRGILYFMPLYLLVASAGMWEPTLLGLPARARVLSVAIGLVTLALAYPADFFSAPGIPTEISYIEYASLYREVKRRCVGEPVLDASPSPHIGLFHGVRPDLALFTPSESKQDSMVERGDDGELRTVFGQLKVAQRFPATDGPACLIVRQASAGRLLSRRFRKALRTQTTLARFAGITLYEVTPAFLRRHPN